MRIICAHSASEILFYSRKRQKVVVQIQHENFTMILVGLAIYISRFLILLITMRFLLQLLKTLLFSFRVFFSRRQKFPILKGRSNYHYTRFQKTPRLESYQPACYSAPASRISLTITPYFGISFEDIRARFHFSFHGYALRISNNF